MINLEGLTEMIESFLFKLTERIEVFLEHPKIKLLNTIYKQGKVERCEYRENGVYIKARLPILTAKKVLTEI